MSKSGEILRIGHGNYSFLCIHCGFHFFEINEILHHIDYHFDVLDSKISSPVDANNCHDSAAGISQDIRDYTSENIDKLSAEEVLNSKNILTEFKTEDSGETISPVEELPLDVKILDDKTTVTVPLVSPRIHRKKTRTKTATKAKETVTKNRKEEVEHKNPVLRQISDKVFQCYLCGNFCKHFSALKRHLGSGFHTKTNCYQCESKPIIRNEADPRPHKCFLCQSWFGNHVLFRRHFKDVHHEDVLKFFSKRSNCNEYTCYVCKKDFQHKYYLKCHLIVRNADKAFICDICGKTYRTKAILKRHLNVHEGKTYTCEECGKSFPYYARLRIHRYSHRTELNYKCAVCSKAFKVQKYLARHMKMHQDVKAYACKYCGKRFTFSTGRRAHEISQHNAI